MGAIPIVVEEFLEENEDVKPSGLLAGRSRGPSGQVLEEIPLHTLHADSPLRQTLLWQIAGVIEREPVKLIARVLWGMLPLHVVALRVVAIGAAERYTGPFRPFTPATTAEAYHRLLTSGDPSQLRATEIEGFEGRWLVFLEPGSLAVDPMPVPKMPAPPMFDVYDEPPIIKINADCVIPDEIPECPEEHRQRGGARAWRLGWWTFVKGVGITQGPYEGTTRGAPSGLRLRFYEGHRAAEKAAGEGSE